MIMFESFAYSYKTDRSQKIDISGRWSFTLSMIFLLLFTGLLGFTKSLAKEVASRNIRVNLVAPGFIETDMTSDLRRQNSEIESLIPLGKYGKVHEVAETVCFLAETTYITGQVCFSFNVAKCNLGC